MSRRRTLVVTAVPAERDAVTLATGAPPDPFTLPAGLTLHRGPAWDAVAVGVGPAAAAAGTATVLAVAPGRYDLVVAAGIGGGFAPVAAVGDAVVGSALVAADLGAEGPDGFIDLAELGFGQVSHRPPAELAEAVADATGAVLGPVLTVATATGTAERAAALAARHPGAAAEAMEGHGVATAAAAHRLAVLEVRTVSNPVGPRDRAAWRIPAALQALTDAFAALGPAVETWRQKHHEEADTP
ncbi:futalosine hydrolase [Streptomyces sp. 3MP-14]|uniref:Futalosine hydrolase n=1 Tax=Streptomyces mimosae TaxID=2586635 RepID=A0A5N6A899_9ACTN|nr:MULTISPECIES: futalosine hydrolase [Streptomyces]KAB8164166.1 futalosine hydrolase [Streptomyces mimosae]KAB8176443.1 futalosine hydrolase [Streptomyces sp. 3MP-14]